MSWIRAKLPQPAINETLTPYDHAEEIDFAVQENRLPAIIPNPVEALPLKDSRRRLMASMFIGLMLGVLLPIGLFLPLYRGTPGEATELASSSTTGIHIVVSNDASLGMTVDTKTLASAIQAPAQIETQSDDNLSKFLAEHPVNLKSREYLYVRGEPRTYLPGIILEKLKQGSGPAKVTAKDLRVVSGDSGRMIASGSTNHWQGQWSYNSPEKNVEVGKKYLDYLGTNFGGNFGDSLSVIPHGESKILSSIARNSAGPTGIK